MAQTVSPDEVAKSSGRFSRAALQEPLTITRHGQDSLVLLSHAKYERLKPHDRVVMTIDQVPVELRDAVAAAEPSAEAERFNAEPD